MKLAAGLVALALAACDGPPKKSEISPWPIDTAGEARDKEAAKQRRDRMRADGVTESADAGKFFVDATANVIAQRKKVENQSFYIHGKIARISSAEGIAFVSFDVAKGELMLGVPESDPTVVRLRPGMRFGALCGPTLEVSNGGATVIVGKCKPYTIDDQFLQ